MLLLQLCQAKWLMKFQQQLVKNLQKIKLKKRLILFSQVKEK